MCDPVSIGLVVGSAALSGIGAAQQAGAQQQSDYYNAQVAANNALVSSQQRSAALTDGLKQQEQSQLHQQQVLGEQKATLAANGVDLNSGSAIDQLATTKFLGAEDVANIQSSAARTAWGYGVQEANYKAQSQLDKWQADNINPAAVGAMSGASSLLGSATQYKMAGGSFGSGGGSATMKIRSTGGTGW